MSYNMKELFKNTHISFDGNSFTLFLDSEPILSDVLSEDDDWFGFELNGNEYDLNIWKDDDSEMRKASIYIMNFGETDTNDYVNIPILNNE